MRQSRRSRQLAWLVAVAAIAAGFAFRARVIAMPIEVLTARYLADDYFYYLSVAEHLAHTGRSTADGLTITNGYQPLFLLMLTGVFLAGAGKIAAVTLGLVIQALALAAAAGGFVTLGVRRDAPWAGAGAASLLALNLF